MNQLVTGKFIALKRKQKNLTQEQLAEKLGVSNKTISKWETGKCMPDYSIIKSLCEELEVTVAELMDGEMSEEKSVRTYDDEQILDLLRRTQELEKQKKLLYGIILIVMGIALQALSYAFGGSNLKILFQAYYWIVNCRNAGWSLCCWKIIDRKINFSLAERLKATEDLNLSDW